MDEEQLKELARQAIFKNNEERVSVILINTVRYFFIVYPIMLVFNMLGVFQIDPTQLYVDIVLGFVMTQTPYILYRLGKLPVPAIKYVVCIALDLTVLIMGANENIGIYMTYALVPVITIIYYNPKFTLIMSIVNYVCIVVANYFRSAYMVQVEYDTNFMWFFSRSLGYLIEAIVMTIICMAIAQASHVLLVRIASEKNRIDELNSVNAFLTKSKENLEKEHYYDNLTGIYGRYGFYSELPKLISSSRDDTSLKFFIVSIDMDGLKHINDTFGHNEGDVSLKCFADCLKAASLPGEVISRFGGDEYVLAGVATDPDARFASLKDELYKQMAHHNENDGKPYEIGASMGVASTVMTEDFNIADLYMEADKKMYEDKKARKKERKN